MSVIDETIAELNLESVQAEAPADQGVSNPIQLTPAMVLRVVSKLILGWDRRAIRAHCKEAHPQNKSLSWKQIRRIDKARIARVAELTEPEIAEG